MSTILECSILDDVKKLLGIPIDDSEIETESYDPFNMDLIIHINSVFNRLRQLGVGPASPFSISSRDETWGDFFGDFQVVEMVRSYMFLKVKMQFDPPSSSIASEAYKNQIAEYEWCMNVDVETDW